MWPVRRKRAACRQSGKRTMIDHADTRDAEGLETSGNISQLEST
jgi:hypothetical protein